MEQGGWLDQILLFVLRLLNEPWLAVTVSVGGGFLVGYLAKISPKGDWESITDLPGRVMTASWFLLATAKPASHYALPSLDLTCDHVPGPAGIPIDVNCHFVGRSQLVVDYTFGDLARQFFTSLVQDIILSTISGVIGLLLALLVLARRRR